MGVAEDLLEERREDSTAVAWEDSPAEPKGELQILHQRSKGKQKYEGNETEPDPSSQQQTKTAKKQQKTAKHSKKKTKKKQKLQRQKSQKAKKNRKKTKKPKKPKKKKRKKKENKDGENAPGQLCHTGLKLGLLSSGELVANSSGSEAMFVTHHDEIS